MEHERASQRKTCTWRQVQRKDTNKEDGEEKEQTARLENIVECGGAEYYKVYT